jgi:hypothetical protein
MSLIHMHFITVLLLDCVNDLFQENIKSENFPQVVMELIGLDWLRMGSTYRCLC